MGGARLLDGRIGHRLRRVRVDLRGTSHVSRGGPQAVGELAVRGGLARHRPGGCGNFLDRADDLRQRRCHPSRHVLDARHALRPCLDRLRHQPHLLIERRHRLGDPPRPFRTGLGELPDFAGDDREAFPGRPRARRLDRRVERQQLGLRRQLAGERHELRHRRRRIGQPADR